MVEEGDRASELHPYADPAAACRPQRCSRSTASDVLSSQLRKRGHATHRAERHPTQRLCCNFPHSQPPFPGSAPESQLSSQPRVGLRRNPNHPPCIHIQEAPNSPGAPSATLVVHTAGVSHRTFPAPVYAAGARSCRSRLLIRTTVMSITTARSPYSIRGGEWCCIYRVQMQLSISLTYHLRGEGDRRHRHRRTHTHTAMQLDQHDAERSGNGNAGRGISKADHEEEINNMLADTILKRPEKEWEFGVPEKEEKREWGDEGLCQSV
ncbi:hypothetical protein FIBSPDRAFT_552214 [Athelia psychrophila]|uniref:Uncharacterized protein n=1 Tax=Athelia psychrophila TaxID=1759441 RepID=A0A166UWR4_9AGAM|nr:hypothetical protein FIBSPDRAFT_552214 [Fibularhizoctonia sp. CBS 109695]